MSPEQLFRLSLDARTDQFSFCTALYEGLYRQRPFAGDNWEAMIWEVTRSRIKPVPKSSPVPTWVRRVLLRGLRIDPKERYPSMEVLLRELVRDVRSCRGYASAEGARFDADGTPASPAARQKSRARASLRVVDGFSANANTPAACLVTGAHD